MSLDTFRETFRRPFQAREFLDQTWMIASVSLVPTLLVGIPFTVLVNFTINVLLREIGSADLSGAGTAFGTITQLGPVVTVLVVAGAGATAICADLGARTIREEIDTLRVLGIDPIHRLVVPRVLASMFVALLLNGLVSAIGIAGGYVFSVLLQGVNPGAFVNGLPFRLACLRPHRVSQRCGGRIRRISRSADALRRARRETSGPSGPRHARAPGVAWPACGAGLPHRTG